MVILSDHSIIFSYFMLLMKHLTHPSTDWILESQPAYTEEDPVYTLVFTEFLALNFQDYF